MQTPKPPRPPFGSQIKLKDGNLVIGQLWQKWSAPAVDCVVQTIDQTGRRVTVTRALTVGLFALGAKKRTGIVSVVISTPSGETKQHRVKADFAERTLSWAVAFNAWREAVAVE